MSKLLAPVAILDANVLYPAPLRDYLLNLADLDQFQPKWTDTIQEEWVRNLLLNRPDLKKADLDNVNRAMNSAFPDAAVFNYQRLIKVLSLPDPDDRHVLAGAIRAKANVIVTFNLKDFPAARLKEHQIIARHPDEFVMGLLEQDTETGLLALENQVKRLKNPPLSAKQVLEHLKTNGLVRSVEVLRSSLR